MLPYTTLTNLTLEWHDFANELTCCILLECQFGWWSSMLFIKLWEQMLLFSECADGLESVWSRYTSVLNIHFVLPPHFNWNTFKTAFTFLIAAPTLADLQGIVHLCSTKWGCHCAWKRQYPLVYCCVITLFWTTTKCQNTNCSFAQSDFLFITHIRKTSHLIYNRAIWLKKA